jgi:hypothetical protein
MLDDDKHAFFISKNFEGFLPIKEVSEKVFLFKAEVKQQVVIAKGVFFTNNCALRSC